MWLIFLNQVIQIKHTSADQSTVDGCSLWQDGDRSHSSVLQLMDGTVLGPPAVRTDPQEVTHLVRSLTGVQHSPGFKHTFHLWWWRPVHWTWSTETWSWSIHVTSREHTTTSSPSNQDQSSAGNHALKNTNLNMNYLREQKLSEKTLLDWHLK